MERIEGRPSRRRVGRFELAQRGKRQRAEPGPAQAKKIAPAAVARIRHAVDYDRGERKKVAFSGKKR